MCRYDIQIRRTCLSEIFGNQAKEIYGNQAK
jgi:hypothetical protein